MGEKQSSERQRRQERLLTSGYGACRYSAGRGERGVVGERGGLFVSEDVFPQMQCLRAAVCERASVFVCNLPGQIPL